MACGCNKKRAGSGANGFVWQSEPDPVTGEFTTEERRTEVEVRAMVIRQGGTWFPK